VWFSVDGVPRNSQFINSGAVRSQIWNSTEIGQEMRKLWEHHLHPRVKYGFYYTDFHETHCSSTALGVDPQYRMASFKECYYVCDMQWWVITMAAPQRELWIFNATFIYWTRFNHSKICYKINLLNLKYSHCRPVHSATLTPPPPPHPTDVLCVKFLPRGMHRNAKALHMSCPKQLKSVACSVTSQHGNLIIYSAVLLGQHSVTHTYPTVSF
jgi:hypothetical protein